ncbi:hypothetical protein INT45_007694, partial [Circinella minor]
MNAIRNSTDLQHLEVNETQDIVFQPTPVTAGAVVEHNITTYLSVIESAPEREGVQWNKAKEKIGTASKDSNKKNRRVNNCVILWTHIYVCHREGAPRIRIRPSKSGQKRPDQKPTKKIGCCAKLLVRCYQDDPDMVTFYYERSHHNHTPGSMDEIRHLKLQD